MNSEKEVWKDIKNYEGLYQVSNLGRAKSLARYLINGNIRRKSEINLKQQFHNGYLRLYLQKENKPKSFAVHILVLNAFKLKISLNYIHETFQDFYLECNHKDANKSNNNINNLEWVTKSENMKHAHKNGLIKISEEALNNLKDINTGSLNPNSKLNEESVKVIKYFLKHKLKTCKQLASTYNVSIETIFAIKQDKSWKHVVI